MLLSLPCKQLMNQADGSKGAQPAATTGRWFKGKVGRMPAEGRRKMGGGERVRIQTGHQCDALQMATLPRDYGAAYLYRAPSTGAGSKHDAPAMQARRTAR